MKMIRIIKKINTLILTILLICNYSNAAVVADNDGSAFITKAEFDSLKNSFQSQLDQYNSSIDSKIDSAIAGYLAGIKVEKKISPIVLKITPKVLMITFGVIAQNEKSLPDIGFSQA